MAEIIEYPGRQRKIGNGPSVVIFDEHFINDQVNRETFRYEQQQIAAALEYAAAAQIELSCENRRALSCSAKAAGNLITEEVVISLAHSLIHVIHAKGNRNSDRLLRAALVRAIAVREGAPDEPA